jgi:hypothetical protein
VTCRPTRLFFASPIALVALVALAGAATGCSYTGSDCALLGECAPSGSTGAGGSDAGARSTSAASSSSSSGKPTTTSAASSGACGADATPTTWAEWPMPNPVDAGAPNPAAYDSATPGVVVDTVTGLMWQAAVDPGTYDSPSAKAFCKGLSLAGHADWRLPARVELVSLLDFTRHDPAIDANAFPDTPSNGFWTTSPVAGAVDVAWYVDFRDGSTYNDFTYRPYAARCVR